ncbi:hypothetical protein FACS1894202_11720 [Clostridia bacterium]|nr:hypothetical protein FACS1894202_11720 [Clostridia bacterium]
MLNKITRRAVSLALAFTIAVSVAMFSPITANAASTKAIDAGDGIELSVTNFVRTATAKVQKTVKGEIEDVTVYLVSGGTTEITVTKGQDTLSVTSDPETTSWVGYAHYEKGDDGIYRTRSAGDIAWEILGNGSIGLNLKFAEGIMRSVWAGDRMIFFAAEENFTDAPPKMNEPQKVDKITISFKGVDGDTWAYVLTNVADSIRLKTQKDVTWPYIIFYYADATIIPLQDDEANYEDKMGEYHSDELKSGVSYRVKDLFAEAYNIIANKPIEGGILGPFILEPVAMIGSEELSGQSALIYDYEAKQQSLSAPSSWAQAAVDKAKTLGLDTADLTNGYQTATTRAEFCRAAVNFLRKYGYDVDGVTPKLFADTSDKDIGIAAALGITSGTDTAKNLFSPDGTLTREQAATMLRNVLNVIGKTPATSGVAWTDAKEFSSWAKDAADVMYGTKIMGGTSTTELVFSPKTPYTHEQSIVTIVNMWNYVK